MMNIDKITRSSQATGLGTHTQSAFPPIMVSGCNKHYKIDDSCYILQSMLADFELQLNYYFELSLFWKVIFLWSEY